MHLCKLEFFKLRVPVYCHVWVVKLSVLQSVMVVGENRACSFYNFKPSKCTGLALSVMAAISRLR